MAAAQRVLVDTPATLTAVFYVGETPTDPGGATATVTITRPDSTVLVTAGVATRTGAGTFTYPLGAQAAMTRLKAVWTGTDLRKVTTWVDVAGGVYAELAEIRALQGLEDTVAYPTAALESARAKAETLFEDETGMAWVPRYGRTAAVGDGTCVLLLEHYTPRVLTSVTIDGTAVADLTAFDLEAYGGLTWTGTFTSEARVVVEYSHGQDAPPEDLRHAALRYVRHLVLGAESVVDERALSITNQAGQTIQLATASQRRPTGLPDVDAILNRHDHRSLGLSWC
jgi:hypothetical protein